MPIYEYRCRQCEAVTDVLQLRASTPPPRCKACQGEDMERLISRTSFQLKGSGWYTSDYARSANAEAKGDAKAAPKGEDKAAPVAEPKPEGCGAGACGSCAPSSAPSAPSPAAAG
jgi:putative FmdB family regulatory protein